MENGWCLHAKVGDDDIAAGVVRAVKVGEERERGKSW